MINNKNNNNNKKQKIKEGPILSAGLSRKPLYSLTENLKISGLKMAEDLPRPDAETQWSRSPSRVLGTSTPEPSWNLGQQLGIGREILTPLSHSFLEMLAES